VRRLAVVPERLAVIARDHDPRRAAGATANTFDEARERIVHVGHLLVVTRVAAAAMARRGLVRIVRIEQVHPDEESPLAVPGEPRERRIDNFVGPSLGVAFLALARAARHAVVVEREPAGETERVIERIPADERRGRRTGVRERLGHGRHLWGQRVADVVPHPVLLRPEAREQARVRGQRQRRRRVHGREAEAVLGQAHEARHRTARDDAIRAQRVDRNQQHGGRHARCGVRPALGRIRPIRRVGTAGKPGSGERRQQRPGECAMHHAGESNLARRA
jgi:hypothetical protein